MPGSVVRVYANPTAERVEAARIALEAEVPGAVVSRGRDGGLGVVTASWTEPLDPATVDRARGVLIEQLAAVDRPLDAWRAQTTATLEQLVATVDRLETAVAELAGRPPAASKARP